MQYSRLLFILLPGPSSLWLFMLLLLLLLLLLLVVAVATCAVTVVVVVLFGCHFSFCNLYHLFCTFAAVFTASAAVASSHFLLAFRSVKDSHHVCHSLCMCACCVGMCVCASSIVLQAAALPRPDCRSATFTAFLFARCECCHSHPRLEDYSGSIVVI